MVTKTENKQKKTQQQNTSTKIEWNIVVMLHS